MSNNLDLCFVTHNKNKLAEIQQMAVGLIRIYGLEELDIREDIPETGLTIEENSAIKARYIFDHFKIPCFADDTGLEVEALAGEPGVHSARYAGIAKDPEANMQKLLKNLSGIENRNARFKTVITYIDKSGNENQFEGIVEGKVLAEKQGALGFGYDPVFQPDGYGLTFAEMSAEQKNTISHRAIAFNKFFSFLSSGK